MKNTIVGFPRIGKLRELKFAVEKYFRGDLDVENLLKTGEDLRKEHWLLQQESSIDLIPTGDFSYYDQTLDLVSLLGAIPDRYQSLGLDEMGTYFAMARGYQGQAGDVKAFAMKKWFNTNYHYMVPELSASTSLSLTDSKPFDEYSEARALGIEGKPVLIGPFTFLKLADYEDGKRAEDFVGDIARVYSRILSRFAGLGATWVQFDEPSLVTDLSHDDLVLFEEIYREVLKDKSTKVLLQTYFGDIRDCYETVVQLGFDGIGLDFVEGKRNLELVERFGFPKDKTLFAGVVNGKNIWKTDYSKSLALFKKLDRENLVLSTSCSLQHVPFTLENESKLQPRVLERFAFAKEKLVELKELKTLVTGHEAERCKVYSENQKVFIGDSGNLNDEVRASVKALAEEDFHRNIPRHERLKLQEKALGLPVLPTTTIGSFPQTTEVKINRSKYRNGEISREAYDGRVYGFIEACIREQEALGLDVLVHGEYERNDMVEFFGENLDGFVFTEKAWVQSYGTRCVKPPIIFGDISRKQPITVKYSTFAQSLTRKPVKGMLTGPVTILNWSFPREDISLRDMVYQIGLAIRDEVLDLERAGIRVIQIDEAALKEKLPLRKEEWNKDYLDFVIPAFRLCHSKVKPTTQIHTHMCYSEFEGIVEAIDAMDADVISFEASRSKLAIIDALKQHDFQTQVGPGVYDIHSPRIPDVVEIVQVLQGMLTQLDDGKLWVNPDCGLKTRGERESKASLHNLVEATKIIRTQL